MPAPEKFRDFVHANSMWRFDTLYHRTSKEYIKSLRKLLRLAKSAEKALKDVEDARNRDAMVEFVKTNAATIQSLLTVAEALEKRPK